MDRPHFLQREPDGPLEPASTEEVAAVVHEHAWHDGIAWFESCPLCQEAKAAGKYTHWFPAGASPTEGD